MASGVSILVCESQPGLARLIESVLMREGYGVETFLDAATASQRLQTHNFDIAIIDIDLPDQAGLELFKETKELSPDTDVFLLGQHLRDGAAQLALRYHAEEFISKPIHNPLMILPLIGEVLKKKSLLRKNQEISAEFRRKVNEISLLYEISRATSYTLDPKKIVQVIMESLNRVLEFDVAASLFVNLDGPHQLMMEIYQSSPIQQSCIDFIRRITYQACSAMFESEIPSTNLQIEINQLAALHPLKKNVPVSQETLASYFHIPLVIANQPVGLIFIGAFKENAFSQEDSRLLFSIANQLADAIQRLRHIVDSEKEKMKTMVESMDEGVIMTGLNGEVVFANPQAHTLLDFDANKPMTSTELKKYFDHIGAYSLCVGPLEVPESQLNNQVLEVCTSKIPLKVLEISQNLVSGEQGKTMGIVTIIRDITERKNIEEMKDAFLSTVSHELRTPLTIIKGAVCNLYDGIVGPLSSQQQKVISIAQSNVNRLSRLINDLLDLSRLESGRAQMNFMRLDVEKIIDEVKHDFETLSNATRYNFTCTIEDDLPAIFGDHDLIHQAFTNLVHNALRYANQNIEIRARLVDGAKLSRQGILERIENPASQSTIIDDEVPRILAPDNQYVEFTIIDDGPGIPPESRADLFNKFVQINRPMGGAGYKGTGLGLSICNEIVKRHRGQIWVGDHPNGRGAQFSFVIPQYQPHVHFWSFLQQTLMQTPKQDKLGVGILEITNMAEMARHLTESERAEFLGRLEQQIEKQILRRTDRVFRYQDGRFFMVIAGIGHAGEHSFRARVNQLVSNWKIEQGATIIGVKTVLGLAIYPDDALNAERLVDATHLSITHSCAQRKKVLIIDDEGVLLEILTVMLQSEGFLVDVAMDGQIGLSKIATFNPDIILMDLAMPKMDGLQVLRKIRASDETKNLPVVILSSHGHSWSAEELTGLGVSRLLKKPIKQDQLLRILKHELASNKEDSLSDISAIIL